MDTAKSTACRALRGVAPDAILAQLDVETEIGALRRTKSAPWDNPNWDNI